jgi:hypothetical protein
METDRISDNVSYGMDIEASPKISESTSNDGFFSTNGNTSYTRIGLIVVILLFLGVNIFSYLGDLLQIIKDALAPLLKNILESFGYVVTETTKDVTQVTAAGAKLGNWIWTKDRDRDRDKDLPKKITCPNKVHCQHLYLAL